MYLSRKLLHSSKSLSILLILLGISSAFFLTSCSRSGAEATGNAQGVTPAGQGQDSPSGSAARSGGAGGGARGGRGGRGDAGAVPVLTAKVAEMSLPVMLQGVGNVEAYSTVEIRPQVSGPLLTVDFTEGQDVTK